MACMTLEDDGVSKKLREVIAALAQRRVFLSQMAWHAD